MLRKAIRRYAASLERLAAAHTTHAIVLNAVAHRLRHILADHPATTVTEYAVRRDGQYIITDTLPTDEPVYTRQVTYTEWEEMK